MQLLPFESISIHLTCLSFPGLILGNLAIQILSDRLQQSRRSSALKSGDLSFFECLDCLRVLDSATSVGFLEQAGSGRLCQALLPECALLRGNLVSPYGTLWRTLFFCLIQSMAVTALNPFLLNL